MNDSMEGSIGRLLRQKKLSLAVAESCTGGLICSRVTDVSGSSDYFPGGIVAYSNEIKVSQLGVSPETLKHHGAVSEQTVVEMAQGIRHRFNSGIGLSVSGIAGPSGGTPDKPVGTVWVGLSTDNFVRSRLFRFKGDRLANKESAARAALEFLLDYLGEESTG